MGQYGNGNCMALVTNSSTQEPAFGSVTSRSRWLAYVWSDAVNIFGYCQGYSYVARGCIGLEAITYTTYQHSMLVKLN